MEFDMSIFESASNLFNERFEETESFTTIAIELKNNNIISRNNEHILKSNILLMQYNILESVFLELYKCLYEDLKTCNLSIDSMNTDLMYKVYGTIKRSNQKKNEHFKNKLQGGNQNQHVFSKSTMSIFFDLDEDEKKFLVNGNLDGRKIKKFLKEFGVDISKIELLDLRNMQTLKDNRQLLAHGGSSFSDIGKSLSWESLDYSLETIKILFLESKVALEAFCSTLGQNQVPS